MVGNGIEGTCRERYGRGDEDEARLDKVGVWGLTVVHAEWECCLGSAAGIILPVIVLVMTLR